MDEVKIIEETFVRGWWWWWWWCKTLKRKMAFMY